MLLKICITATLETQTAFVMFQINKIIFPIHLQVFSWCVEKYSRHSKTTGNANLLLTAMVQETMGRA
jgi:hypothetical protein